MKKAFVFLILFCANLSLANAGQSPIDLRQTTGADYKSAEYYVQQVGEAMISQLRQKIMQISQSYIQRAGHNYIDFNTVETQGCPQISNTKNSSELNVARIQYQGALATVTHPMQTEKISYFGCSGKLLFSEIIQVSGENTKLLTSTEVVAVIRKFALQDNESRRLYRIVDGDNQTLITIDSLRNTKEGWTNTVFKATTEELLQISNLKSKNIEKLYIHKPSYSYKFNIDGDYFNVSSDLDVTAKILIAENGYRYFYSETLTSQSIFDSQMNSLLFDTVGKNRFGDILDYLMSGLPQSKASPKLNKLIDELNEALVLLQSNQNKDRVIQIIQELLAGANLGSILDNRQ